MDLGRSALFGVVLGLLGAAIYAHTNAIVLVLFWAAASWLSREPRVPGFLGWLLAALVYPAMGTHLTVGIFLASQAVPRAAMAGLGWIARPAADSSIPNVTTPGAILSMAAGIAAAALSGRYALLMFVASLVTVRIVVGLAYKRSGGISSTHLGWTRQILEIAIFLIARLPVVTP
ncbi:MAG: hypothetical protein WDO18_03610 [Acidobacteriota bacterium]